MFANPCRPRDAHHVPVVYALYAVNALGPEPGSNEFRCNIKVFGNCESSTICLPEVKEWKRTQNTDNFKSGCFTRLRVNENRKDPTNLCMISCAIGQAEKKPLSSANVHECCIRHIWLNGDIPMEEKMKHFVKDKLSGAFFT